MQAELERWATWAADNPHLAQIQLEWSLAETSFGEFVEDAWPVIDPTPYVPNWHIDAIADHLVALADCSLGHRKLMINVPPGMSKSLIVCVLWPAYCWGPLNMPHLRFMFTSYRGDLALRDGKRCRDLIGSSWYQDRWGDRFKIRRHDDAAGRFSNYHGGYRLALPISGIMGEGGDFVCFAPGTEVITEHGLVALGELVDAKTACDVLSFDHVTGQLEWQPITGHVDTIATDLVRLDFDDGTDLTCTADHRIFVEGRGYIEAGQIEAGARVAQIERWEQLPEGKLSAQSDMPGLRHDVLSAAGTCSPSQDRHLLFPRLLRHLRTWIKQPAAWSLRSSSVRELWSAVARQAKHQGALLQPQMQGRVGAKELAKQALHSMRSFFSGSTCRAQTSAILLDRMCFGSSQQSNCRPTKWAMAAWGCPDTASRLAPIHSEISAPERRQSVPRLWDQARRLRQSIRRPSHRLRQDQSRIGKPDHGLPVLPRQDARRAEVQSCLETKTVRSCEQIHGRDRVVCINVAKNRNFFANGSLVHNCLDDPHSVEQAESDEVRDSKVRLIRLALPTRVRNWTVGGVVCIMQRLHGFDYCGYALEHEDDWDHLCFPARFEGDHPYPTRSSLGFRDPRSIDGELLCAERFSEEQLAKLEVELGGDYGAAGQFQQRPMPRSGGMFKREKFQVIPATEVPAGGRAARGWDLAGSKGKLSANTAGVRIRLHEGRLYIEHAISEKWGPDELAQRIRAQADLDGQKVKQSIPQDPGSSGLFQAHALAKELHGYPVDFSPETGDKATRAQPLAGQVSASNVWLVRGPWNDNFVDEAASFPLGRYRDQIDAASRAYRALHGGARGRVRSGYARGTF